MLTTREQTDKWLQSIDHKTTLTPEELREVEEILGTPGLSHIIGLLKGSRQFWYIALTALDFSNPAQARQGSVIQGQIKGVELFAETLLDLHKPAANSEGTSS